MKVDQFVEKFEPIAARAESEGDVYFVCYFSKQEDNYQGFKAEKMDAGDALIIITELANAFDLGAVRFEL